MVHVVVRLCVLRYSYSVGGMQEYMKETTTPSKVGRALHRMDRIYVFQLTQPYHLYRHVHEQSVIETSQICLKMAIFHKER